MRKSLTDTDRAIMGAFEQLMDGRPEISDGSFTVVNIAAEAGISRASYYRSPVATAIKEILAAPNTRRPETDELKAETVRLRKELRKLRRQKAEEISELRQTVATYANHIQVLTLRNKELEGETAALRGQIKEATGGTVQPIRPRHEPFRRSISTHTPDTSCVARSLHWPGSPRRWRPSQ